MYDVGLSKDIAATGNQLSLVLGLNESLLWRTPVDFDTDNDSHAKATGLSFELFSEPLVLEKFFRRRGYM